MDLRPAYCSTMFLMMVRSVPSGRGWGNLRSFTPPNKTMIWGRVGSSFWTGQARCARNFLEAAVSAVSNSMGNDVPRRRRAFTATTPEKEVCYGLEMRGSQLVVLIAFMGATCLPTTCLAQLPPSPDEASARKSLHAFLENFDSELKDRFTAALVDLNGDGKPEAVVYLTGKGWCGSGGCTTLILVRDGDSWRLLTKVTITRPPIRVLASKSKGWRSIGIWVAGGGIQPGYEAELRLDGKTYPTNPSTPPARPLTGKADGKTIIAEDR